MDAFKLKLRMFSDFDQLKCTESQCVKSAVIYRK